MIGVDEVGRGCLAGPLLVVAARQKETLPNSVNDSKLLSRQDREELIDVLIDCCEFGEGWVKCTEIDKYGLAKAMRLGVARALKALQAETHEEIVMDGPINYLPKKYKNISCIIDADFFVPIVSAASIYAKVARDNYMRNLKSSYPDYGFESHVGYGTAFHLAAIKQYGSIKNVHRMSFRPIRITE